MHVAIIGAGLAGVSIANALAKRKISDLNITIIDPKSFVEVPYATIRSFFDIDTAKGCTFLLAEWAVKRGIVHKRASATALSSTSVGLDNGEVVEFDVGIIAVGATTQVPALGRRSAEVDVEARRKRMREEGERLLSKRHVLIVGGGAIGAEYAGDIVSFSRAKGRNIQVTLVHSDEHVVSEFKPAAAAKLQTKLESMGIRVILKDRAVQRDGAWMLESSGEVLDVDEVVMSVGIQPCNRFIEDGDMSVCLDLKGYIKVDDYFRVTGGGGRLFASGDCCDALEKRAVNAMDNGVIVAHNVSVALSAIKDGVSVSERSLKKKVHGSSVFLVLTGTEGGVAQTPLGTTTWFLPALKNRTMFLFAARAAMGF